MSCSSYHTIDLDFVLAKFPTIFRIFGKDLSKQIDRFNEIVSKRDIPKHDHEALESSMEEHGVKTPHILILNILSAICDESIPFIPILGSIYLLEMHLYNLPSGVQNSYKDMLKSPDSYYNLIAELDIYHNLRKMGGSVIPHKSTGGTRNSNYDIECKFDSTILDAEVKFPKNYLTRDQGIDLLSYLQPYCQKTIKHFITVQAGIVDSELEAIEAVNCVLELYKKALESNEEEVTIYSDNPKSKVRSVTVKLNIEFGLIVLLGNMLIVEEEDVPAIRDRLIDGASQIPKNLNSDHITCIFLGSFFTDSLTSKSIEEISLYGDPYSDPPQEGIFNDTTETPDLNHIKVIIFFYMGYFEIEDKENSFKLLRRCNIHCRKQQLLQTQIKFIEAFKASYKDEVIEIS